VDSTKTTDPYLAVLDELRALTMKKRAGYSPGADPFANFRMSSTFGIDPVRGILIRVMDKIARVASLLENPANDQVGESIRDTLMDGGNYLLIAVAFMDSEKRVEQDLAFDLAEEASRRLDEQSERILAEIEADRKSTTDAEQGIYDSSDMTPPEEVSMRSLAEERCCPANCDDCATIRLIHNVCEYSPCFGSGRCCQ
jgi:hypothetical protein